MYDYPPYPPHHFHCFLAKPPFCLASLVKINPEPIQQDVSFKDIPFSDLDRANIFKLLTLLADKDEISLGWESGYLRNLGAQIDHVHPLRFLAFIFSSPRLTNCMAETFKSYFKKMNFIDGLSKKFDREMNKKKLERQTEKDKLDQYLQDFSIELNLPEEKVKEFVKNHKWEELVWFLIYQKKKEFGL